MRLVDCHNTTKSNYFHFDIIYEYMSACRWQTTCTSRRRWRLKWSFHLWALKGVRDLAAWGVVACRFDSFMAGDTSPTHTLTHTHSHTNKWSHVCELMLLTYTHTNTFTNLLPWCAEKMPEKIRNTRKTCATSCCHSAYTATKTTSMSK